MKDDHGRIDLLTQKQITWCNMHCFFEWSVKDDGKIYTESSIVQINDRKKTMTKFFVQFADCKNFYCAGCRLLRSLEGAPKIVDGYFYCSYCKSLESFKGAPENIVGNFSCYQCDSLKSIDGLKNTKIDGKINYDNCSKLKKYDLILSDMNWFRKWQKSEYTADEFLKEYDGFLQAQKYGI